MPSIKEYFPGIKSGVVNFDGITVTNLVLADLDDMLDANGNEILEFDTVTSAVNNLGIKNAATAGHPVLYAAGEADTGINFQNSEAETILILDAVATGVNNLTIANAAASAEPSITAVGADTDIDVKLVAKGAGNIDASTNGIRTKQSVDNVHDTTPTNAQLDTAFGAATGRGFIGTIDDNDGDAISYIVWSTDASWYWVIGTKAV